MADAALPAGGCDAPLDPGLTIEALRARGAQRADPVRFRFIEAFARRTAAHRGEARRVLDARLAQLSSECARRLDAVPPESHGARPDRPTLPAPLAELVRQIARLSAEGGAQDPSATAAAPLGAPAELKALRYFRGTWSRLRVDQQLSRSLATLPENAGPLNSQRLVLQALQQLRDLAPDYLERFMSSVDALLWLDQAAGLERAARPGRPGRGEGDKPRRPGQGRSVPPRRG